MLAPSCRCRPRCLLQVWNILEAKQLQNVLVMGVHTNMCVLGRPFGLRQLSRLGRNVVLVRDMTDTMCQCEPTGQPPLLFLWFVGLSLFGRRGKLVLHALIRLL